ncbi:MAG TPA: dihydrofolate reductase family protein [Thermoplasmata archaeon]|nr:dihydrofolate reductase family protein [Thermoplasmata archaeon]
MNAGPATGRAGRRPVVWVNFAASEDGRIAYAGGRRARLSGPEDLRRVQEMRADVDAILIGVGTVIRDDPSLRVHWDLLGRAPGRSPTRVIVDSTGRTPPNARVLDGSQPTIVATSSRATRRFPPTVDVLVAGRDRVDLGALFEQLVDRGVHRLMVEGGAEILTSVFRGRLFDRCTVYHAPVVIGGRTAPTVAVGPETSDDAGAVRLRLHSVERLGEGYLATFVPP